MQEWRIHSKKADFNAIGEEFGIDPVIARIIRNRDIEGSENIARYLHGTLQDLHEPGLLKDMEKAVAILSEALISGRKVRIIGDYDIDGICSIYILFQGLSQLGYDVDYQVPNRVTDGYGINENLITEAKEAGVEVIMTCDNGIAAIKEIAYAKSLGMKVIVTDHHDIQYEDTVDGRKYHIPEADAVVDPKRVDCAYPCKVICGAVVAWKVMWALFSSLGKDKSLLQNLLEFAAIATVGDIVDLQDENRIIVKEGLLRLAKTQNHGLLALMDLLAIDRTHLSPYHIGFMIGPCLNASGRLDTAKRAILMLLSSDRSQAYGYAGELKALNDERKKLTEEALEAAIEQVEDSMKDQQILVVYLPDCHESIAGIVAGRIKERYYRPSIVLTDGEHGAKGSARSIESYPMFEKLLECSHLMTKFGGHPMAAGLSLPIDQISVLRQELNLRAGLTEEALTEKIWIDVALPLEYLTESFVQQLQVLAPFGKANAKPLFADRHLQIVSYQVLGKNKNVTKMVLSSAAGTKMEAMAFFVKEELQEAFEHGLKISCTYHPEINEYMGRKKLQININGYKIER